MCFFSYSFIHSLIRLFGLVSRDWTDIWHTHQCQWKMCFCQFLIETSLPPRISQWLPPDNCAVHSNRARVCRKNQVPLLLAMRVVCVSRKKKDLSRGTRHSFFLLIVLLLDCRLIGQTANGFTNTNSTERGVCSAFISLQRKYNKSHWTHRSKSRDVDEFGAWTVAQIWLHLLGAPLQ